MEKKLLVTLKLLYCFKQSHIWNCLKFSLDFVGKALFQFVGEMIPKLKSRQSKSSQSESSSQQQGTAASAKKKKGKKGKGK